MALFTEVCYICRSTYLLCATFTIVCMEHVTPLKWTSGTSNFNFKVVVKVSVFMSKF